VKLVPPDSDFKAKKCTKFEFHWGYAPDTIGRVYSTPADPLAVFKWPNSKGRGGERREGR